MTSNYKRMMSLIHPSGSLLKRTEQRLQAETDSLEYSSLNKKSVFSKSQRFPGMLHIGRKSFSRRVAMICLAAILVLGLPVGGSIYWNTPVAYVDLDINPSIEVTINGLNRIISIKGINQDGNDILNELDLKGKDLSNVVKQLVLAAKSLGYLEEGMPNAIALSTITSSKKKSASLMKTARKGIEGALADSNIEAELIEQVLSGDQLEEARILQQNTNTSITLGKLNLIRKLKDAYEENGIEGFDPNEWYQSPVRDILKATRNARGNGAENANGNKASDSASPDGTDAITDSDSDNKRANQGNENEKVSNGDDINNNGNNNEKNNKVKPDGMNDIEDKDDGESDNGTNNQGNRPDDIDNVKEPAGKGNENKAAVQDPDDETNQPSKPDKGKDKDSTINNKDDVKVNPGQSKKESPPDPSIDRTEDPLNADFIFDEVTNNDQVPEGDDSGDSSDELTDDDKEKIKK